MTPDFTSAIRCAFAHPEVAKTSAALAAVVTISAKWEQPCKVTILPSGADVFAPPTAPKRIRKYSPKGFEKFLKTLPKRLSKFPELKDIKVNFSLSIPPYENIREKCSVSTGSETHLPMLKSPQCHAGQNTQTDHLSLVKPISKETLKKLESGLGKLPSSLLRLNRTSSKLDTYKKMLKDKGWSYRSAAPALGVCYVHLALVLTGKRHSKRLLNAISKLGNR